MPVHNALPYLDAAVESILGQTFSNFEFVILDDGSTDGSTERLRHWAGQDPRIRLIELENNLGPARSSSRVAEEAEADIVARMDADDISFPDRLSRQLDVLEKYPDVGVVGGLFEFIDSKGRKIRDPDLWRLTRPSVTPPFGNGPLTYRRKVYDRVGGYREQCNFWEDMDLIIRMARVARVMVIPEAIYQVRLSSTSTRLVSDPVRLENAVGLAYRCIERLEQSGDYEELLDAGAGEDKLPPRVFISMGNVILWAGKRPRLFGRLLRRGRLGFDKWTLGALAWTGWAAASPSTLRMFLRMRQWLRKGDNRVPIDTSSPVVWTPAGKRRGASSPLAGDAPVNRATQTPPQRSA